MLGWTMNYLDKVLQPFEMDHRGAGYMRMRGSQARSPAGTVGRRGEARWRSRSGHVAKFGPLKRSTGPASLGSPF